MDNIYRINIQERHAKFRHETEKDRLAAAARRARRRAARADAKPSVIDQLRAFPRIALLVLNLVA